MTRDELIELGVSGLLYCLIAGGVGVICVSGLPVGWALILIGAWLIATFFVTAAVSSIFATTKENEDGYG
ncbi:amino acid transporter [Sphingomonas trueperi]|uniref:hypothetical protein n=1 Tax=Sphingomonas trueperi TaxID=53317 RepID=UPI0033994ADB